MESLTPRAARALSRYLVAMQGRLEHWPALTEQDAERVRSAEVAIDALTSEERAQLERVLGTLAMSLARASAHAPHVPQA